MEKIKRYVVPILAGLLVLALITAGVMGFMWGKSSAETRSLKEEKSRYKAGLAERDSIIDAREERVVLLQDSFTRLVKDAVAENARADRRIFVIKEDEDEMHKEINSVYAVSDDSLVRLFNRLADSYEPPR